MLGLDWYYVRVYDTAGRASMAEIIDIVLPDCIIGSHAIYIQAAKSTVQATCSAYSNQFISIFVLHSPLNIGTCMSLIYAVIVHSACAQVLTSYHHASYVINHGHLSRHAVISRECKIHCLVQPVTSVGSNEVLPE